MKTVLVTALAMVLLGACGSATGAGSPTAAPTSHAAAVVPATPAGPSHAAVTLPNGSLVPDAAQREANSPDPNYDYGYVVQITPAGFHPQTLLSGCCLPVTWKNLTQQTVSIAFDHQLVASGAIPPGGTWVFKPPHIESIAYHAASGPQMSGVLQVQQTFES